MKSILGALREIYGLFVEDGRDTVAILAWIVLWAFASGVAAHESWGPPVFFLGFAALLIGSVWRTAAKGASPKK